MAVAKLLFRSRIRDARMSSNRRSTGRSYPRSRSPLTIVTRLAAASGREESGQTQTSPAALTRKYPIPQFSTP